jgi:putative radical SAM enzyme (TIGR03279 family)
MPTRITHVSPGSIADRLGLKAGDQLVRIAGEPVIDQIDYQALTAGEAFDLELTRGGDPLLVRVRKADWEPLGITLDQNVMAKPRPCANHCVFCFIDQMPPGMRETLYVKDDDWRLSLMMGNYITMTNMSDAEFDRVLRRRVSPLYISVHATDPEVRVRMLKNPRAAQLMSRLERLKDAGLRFHCQVVLCPGWNDGAVLDRTLRELSELWPAAGSVALVPVGLTRFRELLPHLTPYDAAGAAALLDQAEGWRTRFLERLGTRFVFPSDEFYCLSGRPIPPDEAYEDYPQIENGVGMLRLFETDLFAAAEDEPVSETAPRRLLIACGTSVAPVMQGWCDALAPAGTTVRVKPIRNRYFGETVTVTGLLTGQDLVAQLRDEEADAILIARNMLRAEGDLFLDDMTLDEAAAALPAPLHVVDNAGDALWRAISGLEGW